ncbi:quinone oxidoreductase family protein [Chitinibacteraceae bacterium HSL-7]
MELSRIEIDRNGGPEVLKLLGCAMPQPGPGEVLLRQRAAGVNFIDTYHRSGLYPQPLPTGLGLEAVGEVVALGAGVRELAVGDRVAYAGGAPGAYATHRVMLADKLVPVPLQISDEVAAATLLRGMTAQYLLKQTFVVRKGMTVLIHAAAGGVGQIACQWAKALGATVIGTVGGLDKVGLAQPYCHHVLDYSEPGWAQQVRALTSGRGVPVVYDGVGARTFDESLDCLMPRGLMVSFGNASGAVPPFAPGLLAQKGSLYLTRPTLAAYTADRAALLACAEDYFHAVLRGDVTPMIGQRYPLAEAARAHEDLEARRTRFATVLLTET